MKLREFISNFVCSNSLVRLWKPIRGGHEIVYKKNGSRPGKLDDVCMEWEILKNNCWQSEYGDCRVIGVTDICVIGHYSEAINIVIETK